MMPTVNRHDEGIFENYDPGQVASVDLCDTDHDFPVSANFAAKRPYSVSREAVSHQLHCRKNLIEISCVE